MYENDDDVLDNKILLAFMLPFIWLQDIDGLGAARHVLDTEYVPLSAELDQVIGKIIIIYKLLGKFIDNGLIVNWYYATADTRNELLVDVHVSCLAVVYTVADVKSINDAVLSKSVIMIV